MKTSGRKFLLKLILEPSKQIELSNREYSDKRYDYFTYYTLYKMQHTIFQIRTYIVYKNLYKKILSKIEEEFGQIIFHNYQSI